MRFTHRLYELHRRTLTNRFPLRWLLVVVLAVTFLVELGIMLVLPAALPLGSEWVEAIADASLLTLIAASLFWWLFVRPLRGIAAMDLARAEQAAADVKVLRGLLPICSVCKNIRDDRGYWNQIELYVQKHSQAEFSHGLCPGCFTKLYPDDVDLLQPHESSHDLRGEGSPG